MITINTLLTEMAKETEKNEVENIPKKSPEWIEAKDKCLVEILKKMNEAKK